MKLKLICIAIHGKLKSSGTRFHDGSRGLTLNILNSAPSRGIAVGSNDSNSPVFIALTLYEIVSNCRICARSDMSQRELPTCHAAYNYHMTPSPTKY